MKEYETLTREKVDVVPFGCGMPETHLMQDWSDRMFDLILNGPTINGIKKDEVRAMLRETYAALKQYEKIGPMASPFINDPTAIVARAFSELYPGVEYVAQYVPDLRDETNGTAYGLTIFPDDGSTPIVCISAEAPISAAPELLAHELAHVATPEDTEHGESWSAASEAIFKKYNELLGTMIPDEPEPILSPHQPGDGGILTMPLRDIIRATGWRAPITVSKRSGLVTKGHGRLMAAQLDDLTDAPVDYQDYASEAEELADLTADNRIAELATTDNKMLAEVFADIDTGEIPFMLSGYTEDDYGNIVTALSEALHTKEPSSDPDAEIPAPAAPVTQYSQLTPEQRQQTLILRDADELGELITNREEAMAAETMLTNGCVMKHIADDVDKADEMEIRFYSEASNPATYTPTAKWDATGGKILKDLEAMIRMLTKRGLRASDLVCSPDVADTIINDAAVQKLLDNRRIEIGNVEPELLPDGAAIVARLNVLGRIISVISYDLTYTDDEGNDKLYIPSGKCVLTAPGAGRTAYGAVSQVEQSDGEFHTYAGRRVPKYVSSAEGNSRTLTISSRPLMIPNNKNPFIVADVLTD